MQDSLIATRFLVFFFFNSRRQVLSAVSDSSLLKKFEFQLSEK